MKLLSEDAIKEALTSFKGWELKSGFLTKSYTFKDFVETLNFMNQVGAIAEEQQHHPDWSGAYNTLTLCYRTHDKNGITEKDILAIKAVESSFR